MPRLSDLPAMDWGQSATSVIKPVLLARGTLETIDLQKTRLMCEEVLGFECAPNGPGRLIMRHRSDKPGSIYWVLDVREVPEVTTPQHLTNHWGIWIHGRDKVDAASQMLEDNKERYGLLRVQAPRPTHVGSRDYSFYFQDISQVWWEIGDHPVDEEFMDLFAHGDWDQQESIAQECMAQETKS